MFGFAEIGISKKSDHIDDICPDVNASVKIIQKGIIYLTILVHNVRGCCEMSVSSHSDKNSTTVWQGAATTPRSFHNSLYIICIRFADEYLAKMVADS